MKISLRLCLSIAEQKKAIRSGVISEDQLKYGTLDVDAASDLFFDVMRATRNTSGNSMLSWINYTKKETADSLYLQVQPGKTVGESELDNKANATHLENLPWIDAGGRLAGVKLPNRITLSKLSRAWKPNNVAGLDQWTEEFVAGPDVVAAWNEKRFTGVSARPLIHRKSQQPLDGAELVYCKKFMPPLANDPTLVTVGEDPPCIRPLGSLVYERKSLEVGLADFNRSAEPVRAYGMGVLIVSQAVREHFIEMKFKGLRFNPVLIQGSDQHQEYLELWSAIFDAASAWKDFSFTE